MKTILLIEDHPDMRENIAEILELSDYNVIKAENGKQGIQQAKEHHPDLIVCDIMMPEMDGYGVLRVLGKSPETAKIPFIFLTAKAEMSDLRKGMNLGADDYLTKPFDDVELLDSIEMRLKKSEIIEADFEPNSQGLDVFFTEAKSMDALQQLSQDREARQFKAKDVIFSEDSYPRHLLFVASGKVKTYKTNEDAKEYTTGLHKGGDFLGYIPLLKDSPHTESAIALEDTEILYIPKEDFYSLIYNNRDVSNKFISMLSNDLAEKEEQLLHLAYDTVRKRVADALLLLESKYQEKSDKPFSMPISRDNLASIVGTSKECVIRVLSEFKDDKLVETRMSKITIVNSEGLAKIKY